MLSARALTSPVTACQDCGRQLSLHGVRRALVSRNSHSQRAASRTRPETLTIDVARRHAAGVRCASTEDRDDAAAQQRDVGQHLGSEDVVSHESEAAPDAAAESVHDDVGVR